MAAAAQAADRRLGGRSRPTALAGLAARLALAALQAARRRGVRVPQDLSVVGFDDVPLAAFADPPLSTLRSARESAEIIADMAIERGATAPRLIDPLRRAAATAPRRTERADARNPGRPREPSQPQHIEGVKHDASW
jgi:LacI family transcriptional regulator